MPKPRMPRSRAVCFTLNNPIAPLVLKDGITCIVYQLEEGEQGTPHYQGYAEFSDPLSLRQAKALLPGAHIEARRGSQAQAVAYCTKEETRKDGPWTLGVLKRQGARNDLVAVHDDVKAHMPHLQLLEKHLSAGARHLHWVQHLEAMYIPSRKSRTVTLLIGPPGSGKTRYVWDKHAELYVTPVANTGTMWFDGYHGQETVLLDDFSGQIPLVQLLRLLHEYPEKVPIKGSHVWWNPTQVYITSNLSPREWYDFSKREVLYQALERRITTTMWFPLEE